MIKPGYTGLARYTKEALERLTTINKIEKEIFRCYPADHTASSIGIIYPDGTYDWCDGYWLEPVIFETYLKQAEQL